jgi:phosphoribosylaminoimidazole carboxylase PurE protein
VWRSWIAWSAPPKVPKKCSIIVRIFKNKTIGSGMPNQPKKTNQIKEIQVGIVGGSKSDFPVLEKAEALLKTLGISSELRVVSAHRTPDQMFKYAETAEERGLEVIIAGAGGAAHLPGMIAAKTHLPVIGVPIPTENLRGLDSLLSIVQMPRGIPVATVAIGGAENAALLAAEILALKYPAIREALLAFRSDQTRSVLENNK